MLKMAAKVTNWSFGRKDANFRGFVKPLTVNTLQKLSAKWPFFVYFFACDRCLIVL